MTTEYLGTKYDEIYEIFIRKITDYDLLSFEPEDMIDIMEGYLQSSIANFVECEDLQYRSDEDKRFKCDLSPLVKEALALLMVEQWVSPRVYNILNMKQFLGDKEYTYYSQANHLEKLKELKDFANHEAERRMIQYGNTSVDLSVFR